MVQAFFSLNPLYFFLYFFCIVTLKKSVYVMDFIQMFPPVSKGVPVESDKNLVPTKCLFGNGLTKAVTDMLVNIIEKIGDNYELLTEKQGREICGQSTDALLAICNNNGTIHTNFGLKKTTEYLENEHFDGEMDVGSGVANKLSKFGCNLEISTDDSEVLPVIIGLSVAFLITFFLYMTTKRRFQHASENSRDQVGEGYNTFSNSN